MRQSSSLRAYEAASSEMKHRVWKLLKLLTILTRVMALDAVELDDVLSVENLDPDKQAVALQVPSSYAGTTTSKAPGAPAAA